jgi:methionyl-tRNA formyltransferase
MMRLGADAVLETVRLVEAGPVATHRQDGALATPAPKIFREDCRIPWDRPAGAVHNHVRGLAPYPGAWTLHGETLLKLYHTRKVEGDAGAPAGTVVEAGPASGSRLVVACGEGAVEVLDVQQEGRRVLGAEAFLRGYRLPAGARLA